MTALPSLKLRVRIDFPSQVFGDGGISVTKVAGVYTIAPDFGALGALGSVTDSANTYTWTYNAITGAYNQVSVASIASSPGGTNEARANSITYRFLA